MRTVGLWICIAWLGACATAPVNPSSEDCSGANAGNCLTLGVNYLKGRGVPKDERRGNALFEKVCDAGDGRGLDFLERLPAPPLLPEGKGGGPVARGFCGDLVPRVRSPVTNPLPEGIHCGR